MIMLLNSKPWIFVTADASEFEETKKEKTDDQVQVYLRIRPLKSEEQGPSQKPFLEVFVMNIVIFSYTPQTKSNRLAKITKL